MHSFILWKKGTIAPALVILSKVLIGIMVLAVVISNLFVLPVEASSGRQEIAFIDSAVKDAQVLAEGIRPGVEIVYLDSSRDGINQIADALDKRHEIDAIHIISHGAQGKVFLGNGVLSNENLTIILVN